MHIESVFPVMLICKVQLKFKHLFVLLCTLKIAVKGMKMPNNRIDPK